MPYIFTVDDDDIAMQNLRSLKSLRLKYNLTQEQLGKIAGCSSTAIYAYENLHRVPSKETYNALAAFFHWREYSHTPKNIDMAENHTLSLGFENEVQERQTSEKKDARIHCCISGKLLNDVKDIASIKGCTVSDIITTLLENYVSPYSDAVNSLRKIRNS